MDELTRPVPVEEDKEWNPNDYLYFLLLLIPILLGLAVRWRAKKTKAKQERSLEKVSAKLMRQVSRQMSSIPNQTDDEATASLAFDIESMANISLGSEREVQPPSTWL